VASAVPSTAAQKGFESTPVRTHGRISGIENGGCSAFPTTCQLAPESLPAGPRVVGMWWQQVRCWPRADGCCR